MKVRMRLFSPLILPLAILYCAQSSAFAEGKSPATSFARFVDRYFDAFYEDNPSDGTGVGFHQYDRKMEDLSAAAVTRRAAEVKKELAELNVLRRGKLTPDEAIDAQILDGAMKSELLEAETIQSWRKNPMHYVGAPGGAVDGLMKRNFAPPEERLRSVIARLAKAPAMLDAMRANVQNPPKEFTDLAIRMAGGSVDFFKEDVAEWAEKAAGSDAKLLKEFTDANAKVIAAFESATKWLQDDLLPRSKGSYIIGAENFSKMLLYEEMIDTPLDDLLAIGRANLEKDHAAFIETAKKIDAGKSPAEVMKSLSSDHPDAENLLNSAKKTVAGIRQFLIDKKIISVPSEVMPIITETPKFARDGSFASMDTPGAYEKKATEAFYYITPVEKDWDAQHREEHLRGFNTSVMDIITIHEAFPGHYIQFLYAPQFPTKTRKLIYCGSNVEGWAHYTEQMMVEEGFGGGDPKIRLAQLSEALLRDCRFVVGIKLHTQGMTVEEGTKIFEEQGFQEHANAYEEARRGTYNPTYLYYTLGKLEIYKLREDYKRAKGAAYSLQTFHSDFVKQGGIPIALIRKILLPGEGSKK